MNPRPLRCARRSVLVGAFAALVGAAIATFALAANDAASSSIQIEVKGTVSASPESVAFKGPVQIQSRTVTDTGFGAAPNVELSIDMSAVAGLGLSTGNKYVTRSHEIVSVALPADGNGEIVIDFPYEASSSKGLSASGVGHANFKLIFVGPSGTLSTGRGWIDTPGVVGARRK
jgi:hypothetical protein